MKRARQLLFSPAQDGPLDELPAELACVRFPLRVYVETEHAADCPTLRDTRPAMADGRAVWYPAADEYAPDGQTVARRDQTGGTRTADHSFLRLVCNSARRCPATLLVNVCDLSRLFEVVRTRRRHREEGGQ